MFITFFSQGLAAFQVQEPWKTVCYFPDVHAGKDPPEIFPGFEKGGGKSCMRHWVVQNRC